MNIPQSILEPFGYTGIPSTRPHRLLFKRAKRQLEICQCKAERWLDNYVFNGKYKNWTDQQIRNGLSAELLHETDWLSVTVNFSHGNLYIRLRHLEYPIFRRFFIRR